MDSLTMEFVNRLSLEDYLTFPFAIFLPMPFDCAKANAEQNCNKQQHDL